MHFTPVIITFATMDLTPYLPDDARSWIPAYAERIGWDKLTKYYDRVFLRLERMRPGDRLAVLQEVLPANYDLFLHCAYTAACELERMGVSAYYFDDQATVITRQ